MTKAKGRTQQSDVSDRDAALIRDILDRVSVSGAIDHEELLGVLMEEGRRAQWTQAEQEYQDFASGRRQVKAFEVPDAPTSTSTYTQFQPDPAILLDGSASEVVEECYGEENYESFAGENDFQEWVAAVDPVMADLADPSVLEAVDSQLLAEAYPHQVGASDHEQIIGEAIDNVSMWSLVAPRTPNEVRRAVQVSRPQVSPETREAYQNVIANLNGDSEDLESTLMDDSDVMFEQMKSQTLEAQLAATTNRRDEMVRKLNSFVTTSGGVASEELLERLLSEGRRIQWERASQDTKSKRQSNQQQKQVISTRASAVSTIGANEMKAKEREMMRELHGRITGSGAADVDGVLDLLLAEVKMRRQQSIEALKVKSKL